MQPVSLIETVDNLLVLFFYFCLKGCNLVAQGRRFFTGLPPFTLVGY